MRLVSLVAVVIMSLLSVVVWRMQPPLVPPGKTPLTWVSDDNPLRKDQIALFNRLNPDIVLRLDPTNEGLEKVIVQSIAGVGPDLFDCRDAFELSAYVRSGVALDLTSDLRSLNIDVKGDAFHAAQGPAVFEGRAYGVPTNVAADGIWFHKDLFDREHVPYPKGPWTWREFLGLAQRMTLRGPDGRIERYGLLFEWYGWRHFLKGFGARIYSEDGARCTIDSAEAIAAVQTMQDLVYRYHVSPSPGDEAAMATQGGWGSGMMSYFGAKRGAMALGGRWWLAQLRNYSGLSLGVAESPYGTARVFHGYGRAAVVNSAGRNRKAAMRFLAFLAGSPYNDLIDRQADGISAYVKYAENAKSPDDRVWLDIARRATPDEVSPFVDGALAGRLIQLQLDLVRAGQKAPAQAMHDAAKAVNEAIAENLREDPALQRRYRDLTGRVAP